MIDYKKLRKRLVNLIKPNYPKGTRVKTKLVTNETGEKEIQVWTRLPTVQYVEVNFEIQKDKP